MKPRILHIIPTLDRAGAEKQLTLLARGLRVRDFDVHVCALTRGGPLAADLQAAGVPLEVIGKRLKFDPLAWLRLKRHIASLKPALVHTWLFAGNSYGRAAAVRCDVPRIVATERCVDPWKAWHELRIDRHLAGHTDKIVVNSPGVRDFYVKHQLPAEKFVVIPNGIGPAPTSRLTRDDVLRMLGLPAGSRLIVAIGRLWAQKRVKDVIWAADLLKVIRDDTHVLIIGDGLERERLERFRDNVRVADRVHFLGHRDDAADLLPHADALWLASEYEGLPNSIMEAMAAGVPVVATDIPGNRDLVVPGETGFLVPLGDRAAFARETERLLTDPTLASQLAASARRRIETEFSIEQMVARHAELYDELLG